MSKQTGDNLSDYELIITWKRFMTLGTWSLLFTIYSSILGWLPKWLFKLSITLYKASKTTQGLYLRVQQKNENILMAMNIRFHSIHLSINSAFTSFLAIHEERVFSSSLNTKTNSSPSILIMISIAIRKYHYQKQHEEWMLTILMPYSIVKGSRGSNSRPELKLEYCL